MRKTIAMLICLALMLSLLPGCAARPEPAPAETEPVRFLFMGRIRREKGIEEFLAAAEAITRKYDNVEFHVVGGCEGDYEGRLHDLQDRGVITYQADRWMCALL